MAQVPQLFRRGREFVVQRYIESPLLLCGRKWDARVYALVTRVEPTVEVCLFHEGFARMSRLPYEFRKGADNYSSAVHLTNSFVAKRVADTHRDQKNDDGRGEEKVAKEGTAASSSSSTDRYRPRPTPGAPCDNSSDMSDDEIPLSDNASPTNTVHPPDGFERRLEGVSCLPLSEAWPMLGAKGFDVAAAQRSIAEMVSCTVRAAAPVIARESARAYKNHFCLFGFDVLFTPDGRPWLMEVNAHPDMTCYSAAQRTIKTQLIEELAIQVFGHPARELYCEATLARVNKWTGDNGDDDGVASSDGPAQRTTNHRMWKEC